MGHVSVLISLLVKSKFFFYFELKLWAFVTTKTVSNRDICLFKAVLLLCEQGPFFISKLCLPPPPKYFFYIFYNCLKKVKFLKEAF